MPDGAMATSAAGAREGAFCPGRAARSSARLAPDAQRAPSPPAPRVRGRISTRVRLPALAAPGAGSGHARAPRVVRQPRDRVLDSLAFAGQPSEDHTRVGEHDAQAAARARQVGPVVSFITIRRFSEGVRVRRPLTPRPLAASRCSPSPSRRRQAVHSRRSCPSRHATHLTRRPGRSRRTSPQRSASATRRRRRHRIRSD